MRKVFVDSGGWLAVINGNDHHHRAAKQFYLRLYKEGTQMLTSNYVLAEVYTRLRYRISHASAVRFHQMIVAAERDEFVQVFWIDPAVAQAAWDIFEKYADQVLSFTDCTSFALARQAGVEEVFAFDQHFAMMGFVVRP